MENKKFRGFDDIHCPDAWIKQLLQETKVSKRKKAALVWKLAALLLFAMLSFATAAACNDTVRDWLTSLFSNGEQVQVQEDPIRVQNLGDITYLDADYRYYVKQKDEQVYQTDTFTIYEKGHIIARELPRKSKALRLKTEAGSVSVKLFYVVLDQQVLPLYLQGREADGMPSPSVKVLKNGKLVIEYEEENFRNAYLVDLKTEEVQSIGDLSYSSAVHAERVHAYAYDVHNSASGRFLLYRTYALQQGWAEDKQECQWVLLDTDTNQRRYMDAERLPGYLLGNELFMAGDSRILTTQSYAVEDAVFDSYPLVYDYQTDTWTTYREYSCATPFTGSLLYRITDTKVKLLDVANGKRSTVALPEHVQAKDMSLQPYNGFYISESNTSDTLDIYVASQKRWVHLDSARLDGAGILFAYPLDEHTLSINQQYLVEFQK